MSFPFYFAADCEEFVTISDTHLRALTGFGIFSDGSARIPPRTFPALAVIDDAVISADGPNEEALDALAAHCTEGCFFDFVRPMTGLHAALTSGLRKRLPQGAPVFLPKAYCALMPEATMVLSRAVPCNHWERFLKKESAGFPAGWCLELIPWERTFRWNGTAAAPRRLPYACCELNTERGALRCYDSPETLRQRLQIARQYGCTAAIGLYRELKELA